MRNLLMILAAAPFVALMFMGCEKETKEVTVHDTIYVEFDEFTYLATGLDSMGDVVFFFDPNYPDEDGLRAELFWLEWEYNNEIELDEYVFFAYTTGTSLGLEINGDLIEQSMPFEDETGFEWQVLELAYNTSKKSEVDHYQMINNLRKELINRREE